MWEDPDTLFAQGSPLEGCHLLITTVDHHGAEVPGSPDQMREQMPAHAVLLVAAAIEAGASGARLPADLPVIRAPVQVDELRAAVRRLLPLLGGGTVLARRVAKELAAAQ